MELEENREIYRKELEKLERIVGNFLREESDIYTFEYEYKSIYKAIKDNISEIKKCRSISYIKKILAYKIVTIFNGQMNHNLSLLSQSDRKFADEQSLHRRCEPCLAPRHGLGERGARRDGGSGRRRRPPRCASTASSRRPTAAPR